MSVALLIFMAVAFMVLAGLLTAAESAYGYLPRHEAEALLQGKAGKPLRRILQHPVAHMHALRFWRVWFEMATAVTVATLFQMLLDNIWLAGLLATVVMAAIGFVLVGVSPRQIGRKHVTAVVVLTAGLVRFLRVVLGPVPGWLVRLGTAVAPGTQGPDAAFFTEEEFRELLDRASEADMIENTEAELIHSVFELGDTKVRSVMVPRTDMVCIEAGSTLRQAMSLFLRSGYSRVPVIEDSADQIVGILYLKDVAAQMHSGSGEPGQHRVEDFARGVRYVPESKAVSELLQELQRESTHVAVVIDEYGGTAGLVTLEDLIEEIVGEIVDEYDSERPEIENLGGGRYRVSSRAGIDDLGELFDVDLEDDEVDTVGGLLAKALGRVPIVGSEVVVDGIVLHAERLEGRRNRVSHIIAWKQPDDADPETHSDDGRASSRVSSTELVPRND
ncbi:MULTISPECIES: hemolysin family protein [Arthrobacter]|uniref:Hemolysin family protein n=1 Tax=Arthrobacter sunyaminii TaxID=2816859 RepID=A0A975S3S9_9MICC|nr:MULTISPECIES: hemolysin family protein [Arthrobacter]MBO0895691.1 HlyC/CorC family transporter [Arthrobacter sunyaminii]MBO0907345.1 HlyC/CorC family transporter [Arthrobacter sunyaminii]QWQ34945.1 hemolysin family protein [Arthrobacter sunyaminii]